MGNKNNLLIITSAFPNNLNSYEWIFIREQILYLKKYFRKVYIIRPQYYISPKIDFCNVIPKTWKEKPLRKKYTIDNIQVFFPRVSIFQPFKNFEIIKFIKNKNICFDLIHSHFLYPSAEIGNYVSRVFWVKHIGIGHGFDVYKLPFQNIYWNYKMKNILKKTHKIISVSHNNIKCLDDLWVLSKSNLIHNGYNAKKFYFEESQKDILRKKYTISWDEKVFISVGNLIPIKNHEYLIEQFSQLWDWYKLFIIWDWYLRVNLENQIKKLLLENKVHILWAINNDELIWYLNASDVFILPSISESTWIAALEAGACWLPIITYKNGWTEEYVAPEYSRILEKGESLSEAMIHVSEQQFDRRKISKFYQRYSWENIIEKNISLYT